MPLETATPNPSLSDLRTMDDLRQVIVQLDEFEHNGPPLSYRFGLYQGNKLAERARHVYFDRFRPIFLNRPRVAFAEYMRPLPDAPQDQVASDTSVYQGAYNPLKAYLITTRSSGEESDNISHSDIFPILEGDTNDRRRTGAIGENAD